MDKDKIIRLNTNLFPCIDASQYESSLSFPYDMLEDNSENYKIWDNMILDIAKGFIFDAISKTCECELNNLKWFHPTSYNYSTDEIDFDLAVNGKEAERIIEDAKDNPDFIQWIADLYATTDGFISYMADSKDEYERQNENDPDRSFAQVCLFNIKDNAFGTLGPKAEIQQDFIDAVWDSIYEYPFDFVEDAPENDEVESEPIDTQDVVDDETDIEEAYGDHRSNKTKVEDKKKQQLYDRVLNMMADYKDEANIQASEGKAATGIFVDTFKQRCEDEIMPKVAAKDKSFFTDVINKQAKDLEAYLKNMGMPTTIDESMDNDHLVGKTIKIVDMVDEPSYSGVEGTVKYIDDMGQLHGTWGGLAVIPDYDTFELIESLVESANTERYFFDRDLGEVYTYDELRLYWEEYKDDPDFAGDAEDFDTYLDEELTDMGGTLEEIDYNTYISQLEDDIRFMDDFDPDMDESINEDMNKTRILNFEYNDADVETEIYNLIEDENLDYIDGLDLEYDVDITTKDDGSIDLWYNIEHSRQHRDNQETFEAKDLLTFKDDFADVKDLSQWMFENSMLSMDAKSFAHDYDDSDDYDGDYYDDYDR